MKRSDVVPYDVIVSSINSRADLLQRTLRSMLPNLDQKPQRVIVNEDAKASEPYVAGTAEMLDKLSSEFGVPIELITCIPGLGLGRAMHRLFGKASTEFVLYTQEDFDFLRPLPVGHALSLVTQNKLNHVRFNKRKTMRCKAADKPPEKQFHKVEVSYDYEHLGEKRTQMLCVSDHWYFQASLWRRSYALEGFDVLAHRAGAGMIDRCEAAYNHWFNTTYGNGCGSTDASARERFELCKTFIWGPIAEPAFIQHTGHDRRSQDWPENQKRDPNS